MALLDTPHRVPENIEERIEESIQERIWRETSERVRRYSGRPKAIENRLQELEREWDLERTLTAHGAAFALAGIALAVFFSPWWLLLPTLAAAFLLEHALQGWCPLLPLLRGMGLRTRAEIAAERYALKAVRGDFRGLNGPAPSAVARAERALKAVEA